MYIKFESDLFIYKQKPKSEEIQDLIKNQERLEKELAGFREEQAFDEEITVIAKQAKNEYPEMRKELDAMHAEFDKKFEDIRKQQWLREGLSEVDIKDLEDSKELILKERESKNHIVS